MKTIHPGHLEHRFCIFGCQILCITDLAIMPHHPSPTVEGRRKILNVKKPAGCQPTFATLNLDGAPPPTPSHPDVTACRKTHLECDIPEDHCDHCGRCTKLCPRHSGWQWGILRDGHCDIACPLNPTWSCHVNIVYLYFIIVSLVEGSIFCKWRCLHQLS